jgi:hypothetical protein
MCTMILHQAKIEGCGKGRLQEWFDLRASMSRTTALSTSVWNMP